MPRVRLIHWKGSEAVGHLEALKQARLQVDYDEQFRSDLMKQWRESPPDAFVIDLSRLPSHGREIAVALRQSKATRSVPLIFCAGDPAKLSAFRELLPDAAYCELPNLISTLKKALAAPPQNPVVPTAMMDRYKSRTAAEKLGVKEGDSVAVVNPPRDFERIIGALPARAQLLETDNGDSSAQVHLCFVHQPAELADTLSRLRALAATSRFWILWRKGGKAALGDVTESIVRENALDLGLVDYKICSVNEIWTAMLFALKRR